MVNLLNVLPVLLDLLFSVTTTVFAVAQPLEDDNKHPMGIMYSLKGPKNCCLILQLCSVSGEFSLMQVFTREKKQRQKQT